MKLSALILAKNEHDIIEDCLSQLSFADEIIVLNQSSVDDTVEIAHKYTKKILNSASADFSQNRNALAKEAKGEWLLYLDCDERLTQDGLKEIEKSIRENVFSAFYFPRKNYLLGKRVKHGGWWPDYAPRLFKREDFISWVGKIHESPKFKGKAGYLKEPLIHVTARSLNLMLEKTIIWAKIEATLYYNSNNPKVTILKVVKTSMTEFIYRYIVKKGLLDGAVGLILAIFQALHKAIIATYLWELQNQTKQKFEQEKQIIAIDKLK